MMTKTKPHGPVKEPWHAVSVVAGPGACPAAERLRDKRLLSDEAPRLPHPECSSSWRCKCIYRHYSDRRAIPRRETDRGNDRNTDPFAIALRLSWQLLRNSATWCATNRGNHE